MIDSGPTAGRSSYLHSSSTPPQHTLTSIRNAIASESQRIRVQDESTGQSYELQLGKGMPYPERFGGPEEDESTEHQAPEASTEKRSSTEGRSSFGLVRNGLGPLSLSSASGSGASSGTGNASGSGSGSGRRSVWHRTQGGDANKGSTASSTTPSSNHSGAAETPTRKSAEGKLNGNASGNADTATGHEQAAPAASSSSTSSSSPIRALRLPSIVRGRHSQPSNRTRGTTDGEKDDRPSSSSSAVTSKPQPSAQAQAVAHPNERSNEPLSKTMSSQSSSSTSRPAAAITQLWPTRSASSSDGNRSNNRSSMSTTTGGAQLQELNKQYHENLAARADSRSSREGRQTRGTMSRTNSSAQTRSPQKGFLSMSDTMPGSPTPDRTGSMHVADVLTASPSRQQQYTASNRHYPIMSELPPSPPPDWDMEGDEGPLGHEGKSLTVSTPTRLSSSVDSQPSMHRPSPGARKASNVSTGDSVYLSADESAGAVTASESRSVAGEDDDSMDPDDTPTTPRQQRFGKALPSTEHTSTTRSSVSRGEKVRPASPVPIVEGSMVRTRSSSAPKASSTSPRSRAFLHPSSAGVNNSAGQSVPTSSSPPRSQPMRRNTAESTTSSSDAQQLLSSGPQGLRNRRPTSSGGPVGLGGTIRRASKDNWMPGMAPDSQQQQQHLQQGQRTSPAKGDLNRVTSPTSIPASASMSSAGPLRTGDAGFDEEVAKQEALIRKRKERARREEEKAWAEQESKKSEAARDREQKDKTAGEKGSGVGVTMPALMRGKSAMGKIGGGGAGAGGGNVASGAGLSEKATASQAKASGSAVTAPTSALAAMQETPDDKALVGNIINEGHVNYVLMYNMLTGIRIGVSRCQAKLKRPLRDEDYSAKHKFTFDIIGNELTPSAKYDFKFKDYAPWVFRELREYFYLDPADYLLSLTAKYILSELGSPGKSGSFFYFSRDYRFIIKTIRHGEHKFLRRILKDYHEHVKANPHTLLSRFYGLHRVKLPHGRKIHFVIMNNLFPPHRDIHETYDLKGSSFGREYPEEKARQKKGATLKDINWIRRGRELELGPEKRGLFEAQLQSDVALLKRLNIMDYSLLIGLHDMRKGNSENLRQEALQVVEPSTTTAGAMTTKAAETAPLSDGPHPHADGSAGHDGPVTSPGPAPPLHIRTQGQQSTKQSGAAPAMVRRSSGATTGTSGDEEFYDAETGILQSPTSPHHQEQGVPNGSANATSTGATSKRASEKDAPALRAAVRRSDTKALGPSSGTQLPARETSERRHFLFYQDEGGFRSTDENNQPSDWIYYLGVIDLFTPYNSVKRGETWWKSITTRGDRGGISSVPPKQYGDRFVRFLSAVVRPLKAKELPPGFGKVEKFKEAGGTLPGPSSSEKAQ